MTAQPPQPDQGRTMTLEAFADTIIPGEKRHRNDHAIAGVTTGGGAVAAGAVALLELPASGFADVLDTMMATLNDHARAYADRHAIVLDPRVPPFVGLAFDQRTTVVRELTTPGHPEQAIWVGLALFSNMAFDSAAHMPTLDAIATGHPGLVTMGYFPPDPDGLWRFPQYSYGRPLASTHPNTTATGSPA